MTYQQTIDYLFSRLPMFSRIGVDAFKKDLTIYPENGWSLFGLAKALEAQNKKKEANFFHMPKNNPGIVKKEHHLR